GDGGRGAARFGRRRHRERVRVARARQPVYRSARAARLHRADGAADALRVRCGRLQHRRGFRPRAGRSPHPGVVMRLPALVFVALLAAALVAPVAAPYAPERIDLASRRESPSATHLFGTDELGRDVFSRVLFGARVSLAVGLFSAAVAGASGVAVGGIAGYAGGAIDASLMRATDAMLAIPRLPLLMIAAVGPPPPPPPPT